MSDAITLESPQEPSSAAQPADSSSMVPSPEVAPVNPENQVRNDAETPDANLQFFRRFQQESTALRDTMDLLATSSTPPAERGAVVEQCLSKLTRLSNDVKEASSYIPAYDQKSYSDTIRALNERLVAVRRDFAPRPKFAFKSRLTPGSKREQGGKVQGVGGAQATETQFEKGPYSLGSQGQGVVISDRHAAWVSLPTAASRAVTSGTISDVRECVVDLVARAEPQVAGEDTVTQSLFASIQIKDVRRSLIVVGKISGPAHITGLHNCIIVVSCRQFRMHDCTGVDVYLECGSRPIIEDCEGIRFAQLPEMYRGKHGDSARDLWDQVDDFKWLKPEPSPHWCVFPETKRVRDEVWNEVTVRGPDIGVEQTLQAVGIK